MFEVGGPEIVVLFGAQKIPDMARSLGASVTEFKKGLADEDHTDLDEAPAD